MAIIGLGTVGSGLAKILMQHSDRITRHAGCRVELAHVIVRSLSKDREYEVPSRILSDELNRVLRDDDGYNRICTVPEATEPVFHGRGGGDRLTVLEELSTLLESRL